MRIQEKIIQKKNKENNLILLKSEEMKRLKIHIIIYLKLRNIILCRTCLIKSYLIHNYLFYI